MKIIKYGNEYKEKWDKFLETSKNGTFLFKRDYMEYHQDRFPDSSFIILDEKDNIVTIIPGTINGEVYYSHRGLTYGGFVLDRDSKMSDVINCFELLNQELKKNGIKKVIYKSIPVIYHNYVSQEDEYALFRLKAKLFFVGISSTVDLNKGYKFNKSRKSSISKSKRFGLIIEKDSRYEEFWEILENNLLETHGAKPVHSLDEILYLKNNFPENIKLYTAKMENEIVAGCLIYEDKEVAHVQYISANKIGKEISALDFIFEFLIKEEFKEKRYFDFGTSVENNGEYLNEGLIFQKEGFGARGIVYKQYEYEIE